MLTSKADNGPERPEKIQNEYLGISTSAWVGNEVVPCWIAAGAREAEGNL